MSGIGGERGLGSEMGIQPRLQDETLAPGYRSSGCVPFTPVLFYCKRERGSDFSRLMFIKHFISDIKILAA